MRTLTKLWMILGLALFSGWPAVNPQMELPVTGDPGQVKFYYDDLHNFLAAFRKINAGADLAQTLKTEYLDKASPALKNYMQDQGFELKNFVGRFDSYKEAYATLPKAPEQLAAQEENIRKALVSMKKVLPKSVFLPIYYLVGISGGLHAEPSEVGIRFAMSRLGSPEHLDKLKLTVVHETVHVQQFMAIGPEEYHRIYEDKQSLLAVSIREGVAEYLTYLITGEYSKKEVLDYIKKDEKRIWERFESEMHNREFGDWLFSATKNPDQPRDVGYMMGGLIVESYYENAGDKEKALEEILKVIDYDGFLAKSRYGEKSMD
jgi:hypothetical protein